MKTTIDIPDTLMARCKALAREQNLTFRDLVEEGLGKVLAERSQRKPFKLRKVPSGRGGFQPGFEDAAWEKIRDTLYEQRGA